MSVSVERATASLAEAEEPREQKKEPVHILVVDDNENNRLVLCDYMELLGHTASSAQNGLQALHQIREHRPDLVLLDLDMPVMDGQELLSILVADPAYMRIPVVIISGCDDSATMAECIRMGAADYLVKPYQARVLHARIDNCLAKSRLHAKEIALRQMTERYNQELEERVAEQVRQISEAQICTIFALSTLAESRDPETGAHLDRIRKYCEALAEDMGQQPRYVHILTAEYIEILYTVSPLHDIGKVGIPDEVLLKPGKLTDEEFDIMKGHCEIGAITLERVSKQFPDNNYMQMGHEIALYHHEKWDGSGYPRKIQGESIPLSCRIIALADVYDALRSKRCYKEAFDHVKSRGIILESAGKHFDPAVVESFCRVEDKFVAIAERYHD